MSGGNVKKILILNGSARGDKSCTLTVARAFAAGMSEVNGYETEVVDVSRLHVEPCTGCLSCWANEDGECVLRGDDIPAVKQKILQADVVISCYPLYFFGMPGVMKTFTDRMLGMMCTYKGQLPPENGASFHGLRYPMPGKKFVLVSSCAYTNAEAVFEPLLKQYDCICGRNNYTAVLCPQLFTLVKANSPARLKRYYAAVTAAGAAFAKNGGLSEEETKRLSRPPFSEEVYKVLLDGYWQSRKK